MILHVVLAIAAAVTPLPDAPVPKVITPAAKPDHSRRIWLMETAVLGSLYAADFTLTARGLGTPWYPGCVGPGCIHMESDPLYGRHPSDTRIALTTAAMFAAETLLLRKTERSRHRWVRWSGRAFFAYIVVDEARCIHSWRR